MNRKYYLLNYIFLIGIVVLFVNDHILKYEFSNWITGKLSDVVGILILPFFLTYLFPKRLKVNLAFTGLFFLFWKSPYSQGLIDFFNEISFYSIARVVDYTDLLALGMLPLSYWFITQMKEFNYWQVKHLNISPILVLLIASFVFGATSRGIQMPLQEHQYSEGNFSCYNCVLTIKKSPKEVLSHLSSKDIIFYKDTILSQKFRSKYRSNQNYIDTLNNQTIHLRRNNEADSLLFLKAPIFNYRIEQIIIRKDTIRDIQFSLLPMLGNRTLVQLNGMNLSANRKDSYKYYKKKTKRRLKRLMNRK